MAGTDKNAMRVLPPDVFDALELSALAFGGIGRAAWYDDDYEGEHPPCCIHGHAVAAEGLPYWRLSSQHITPVLRNAQIGLDDNDRVTETGRRIPFAEWCRRLNVVRDMTPTFDPQNFPPRRSAKRSSTVSPSSSVSPA